MRLNFLNLLCICGISFVGSAQIVDSVAVESLAVSTDSIESIVTEDDGVQVQSGTPNVFGAKNVQRLKAKYAALQQGERQKLRWLHIGDSHIQADLLTAAVRSGLQQVDGNGGRGLVFPHQLAGTNGASDYRIQSSDKWQNYRNIKPVADYPIGLAGIVLYSNQPTSDLQLRLRNEADAFTSAKVIVPAGYGQWGPITGKTAKSSVALAPKSHKIKNGESLSTIAKKYGTTVAQLKKLNGLKSNAIRAGKTLKVGMQQVASASYHFEISPLENGIQQWDSPQLSWELGGQKGEKGLAISGIWLENDQKGHVYASTGVNGAKFSDYLKYPAFFTELAQVQVDALVLSFGTNESYDYQTWEQYVESLKSFIAQARAVLPDVDIIVTTPPPSYLRKNPVNAYAASYAQNLVEQADALGIAVIDIHDYLGGANHTSRLIRQHILSKDRVHYTHKGYQLQGESISQALLVLLQP